MEAQQGGGPTRTTLLEAVQALYHHPDPSIRNAANQWLDEFQHTMEAWQVLEAKLGFIEL
jgi:transportin-3